MRHWILMVLIVGVVMLGVLLPVSGAVFTSSSQSIISARTDSIERWLHLYSQASDPDGLGDYWLRVPPTGLAATGVDEGLRIDLGEYGRENNLKCSRVFTMRAAPSLPVSTAITVTATLLPDTATGAQPISALGFQAVGKDMGTPNPVTMAAGSKLQANLRLKLRLDPGVYRPSALITVTYTGMTATYYQYVVPITVTVGPAGASVAAEEAGLLDDGLPTSTTWESTPPTTDVFEVPTSPSAPAPPTTDTGGQEAAGATDPGSEWLPTELPAQSSSPSYDPTSF